MGKKVFPAAGAASPRGGADARHILLVLRTQPVRPVVDDARRGKFLRQYAIGHIFAMGERAGPPVVGRMGHEARAHGVTFDVAYRRPQVRFIEWAGLEPALPDVPGLLGGGIEAHRVDGMRIAQGPASEFN